MVIPQIPQIPQILQIPQFSGSNPILSPNLVTTYYKKDRDRNGKVRGMSMKSTMHHNSQHASQTPKILWVWKNMSIFHNSTNSIIPQIPQIIRIPQIPQIPQFHKFHNFKIIKLHLSKLVWACSVLFFEKCLLGNLGYYGKSHASAFTIFITMSIDFPQIPQIPQIL